MMITKSMTLLREVLLEVSLSYLTGSCNSSGIYPRVVSTTKIMKMPRGILEELRQTRNGRLASKSDQLLIFRLSNVGRSF